ncbi:ArsR/SmtB family transcription factor [Desertihabitans aurantiacus]|uniref:ArsR/SmtB family transcription factor n=1 Tax=Desertihabitans aurantiacus TaxID=2282477 RepID=UPI001E3938CF|nr:metalloregulator ArsR/SmtB family transcription factor [Desertihabitans aurantiacus]
MDNLPRPDRADADAAAGVFRALGDPVRLRLYLQIAARTEPVCVCDLGDAGVSQPTVSHHLRRLREAGLVDCERRGTWVHYWALPDAVRLVRELLADAPAAAPAG